MFSSDGGAWVNRLWDTAQVLAVRLLCFASREEADPLASLGAVGYEVSGTGSLTSGLS